MESVREVLIPKNNKIEIMVPDNFVGKTIEVIAFEVEEKNDIRDKIKEKTFDAIKLDLSGFKFNRDEANER